MKYHLLRPRYSFPRFFAGVPLLQAPQGIAVKPKTDIHSRISEILSRPEYQPRRNPEGLLDAFKRAITQQLEEWLKLLGKWLEGIETPGIGNSFIGKWLVDILIFLKDAMYTLVCLAVVVGLIYLTYRFILPYLRERHPTVPMQNLSANPIVAEPITPVSDLLSAGQYREALAAMHRNIRRLFLKKLNIPLSATDHEVTKLVSPVSPEGNFFAALVEPFEAATYAGAEVDPQIVKQLYERFHAGQVETS